MPIVYRNIDFENLNRIQQSINNKGFNFYAIFVIE